VTRNLIQNRPPGQTVVAIAHRLSTLRAADQVGALNFNEQHAH
jgi:ABC-type multidrug transport system fused ATPase/permease subunit